MEQTFFMVKPDGVARGLTGQIIQRLENKGFRLAAMKMMCITPESAAQHYAEHQGKPFFEDLVAFITSGPVVAMVWEGPGVIKTVRGMMGSTDPAEAAPGTIRGDLAHTLSRNVVHGSDSSQAALRETALFFTAAEIK